MTEDTTIQTATMAAIFANQGHYEKAAEIYRLLLRQDPSRKDITAALAEIEKKQFDRRTSGAGSLDALVEEWLTLIFQYQQLQNLKKIKKYLNQHGGENGR